MADEQAQESRLSVRDERDQLRRERDALQAQIEELAARMGTNEIGRNIHYRRAQDPPGACRAGVLLGQPDAEGHAHLLYGQVQTGNPETYETTRKHSPSAEDGTWHYAEECPFPLQAVQTA